MKDNLLKNKKNIDSLKRHSVSYNDYQSLSASNLNKQKLKNYNTISAFIVDWQEPLTIEEVKKHN